MLEYKITWSREQDGKKLESVVSVIKSTRKPAVGECRRLLVDPPILECIEKVEILTPNK